MFYYRNETFLDNGVKSKEILTKHAPFKRKIIVVYKIEELGRKRILMNSGYVSRLRWQIFQFLKSHYKKCSRLMADPSVWGSVGLMPAFCPYSGSAYKTFNQSGDRKRNDQMLYGVTAD